MRAKIIKMTTLFIVSISFSLLFCYIMNLLYFDNFNLKNALITSISFAIGLTSLKAYKYFKAAKRRK